MTKTTDKFKTLQYKACRRCGGDLVLDHDEALGLAGEYVCLQCGCHVPLPAPATVETPSAVAVAQKAA